MHATHHTTPHSAIAEKSNIFELSIMIKKKTTTYYENIWKKTNKYTTIKQEEYTYIYTHTYVKLVFIIISTFFLSDKFA